MRVSKYLRDFLSISVVGLSLSGAYITSINSEKPSIKITKQQSSLNINENFFKYFHLGQRRLYSSLFWVATILESDHDHYKEKDLNSWMYLRFLTISNLEPKFLMTYKLGGPYLSIIKDDLTGASVLYDKGLIIYPENIDLLNNAAFHYQFEVHNNEKAYELYKKISTLKDAKNPQISILARLEANKGNLDTAFVLLKNLYSQQQDKNSFIAKRIWEFLYALRAEMDLNCLNASKAKCENKDLNGIAYIKKGNKYYAQSEWIPYNKKSELLKTMRSSPK